MAQQKKIMMKPSSSSTKSKSATDIKAKEVFPTKVIVRRLPPTLTSESFLEEVSPLPDHSYYNFVTADRSLGQYAFCRAVISFKKPDDVFLFREKFDNYVFVDPRGNEYPAVVEFAPYQKVPIVARKVDHRENTLDDDADYKKFLDMLENPEAPPTITVKEVIEEVEAKAKERLAAHNSETPLLAFINKFKIEKKRAQEKLREERRLRELERKRLREEERRNRREREKREREESKANKDASDRKGGDNKKPGSKDDSKSASKSSSKQDNSSKTNSGTGKPGNSSSTTKTGLKTAEKGPTSQKSYPKDDIIVRTLPSAKSKAAEKSRAAKPATVADPKKPTYVATKGNNKSAADRPASTSSSQSSTGSGKPTTRSERVAADGSGSKSASQPSTKAAQQKSSYRDNPSSSYKEKEKITAIKKKPEKRSEKAAEKSSSKSSNDSVGDVVEKTAALKLSDTAAGKTGSEKTPPVIKRNISGHKLERTGSGDSGASDKTDGDSDKSRTARNTRYKDRPERAIYNPGARAAERRAKMQKSTSNTQQPDSGSDKQPSVEKQMTSSADKKQNSPEQQSSSRTEQQKDKPESTTKAPAE